MYCVYETLHKYRSVCVPSIQTGNTQIDNVISSHPHTQTDTSTRQGNVDCGHSENKLSDWKEVITAPFGCHGVTDD